MYFVNAHYLFVSMFVHIKGEFIHDGSIVVTTSSHSTKTLKCHIGPFQCDTTQSFVVGSLADPTYGTRG